MSILAFQPPRKAKPAGWGAMAGFGNEGTAADILLLNGGRFKRVCCCCGISFSAFTPRHNRCRTCFRWGAIGNRIAEAAQLLRGAP